MKLKGSQNFKKPETRTKILKQNTNVVSKLTTDCWRLWSNTS